MPPAGVLYAPFAFKNVVVPPPVVSVTPFTDVVVSVPPVMVGDVSNTNFPVPVAPVEVTPSMVWWPVKVLAASVLASVADVVGNVMVVPSVPARVRELETVSSFPEATLSARYDADQFPAVVGVATSAVKIADVPPARTVMVLAPDGLHGDCAGALVHDLVLLAGDDRGGWELHSLRQRACEVLQIGISDSKGCCSSCCPQ